MSDWRRVSDEMPPDGRTVLAYFTNGLGKGRRIRATYYGARQLPVNDDTDIDEQDYDEATDTYFCPAGWYETNEYEDVSWRVADPVTHWMPLPDPPKE